jgi:hypothetical protein
MGWLLSNLDAEQEVEDSEQVRAFGRQIAKTAKLLSGGSHFVRTTLLRV